MIRTVVTQLANQLGELNDTTLVEWNAEVVVAEVVAADEPKAKKLRLLEVGTLQWAIPNASIGSFGHNDREYCRNGCWKNSEALIIQILLAFMQGSMFLLEYMEIPGQRERRAEVAQRLHDDSVMDGSYAEAAADTQEARNKKQAALETACKLYETSVFHKRLTEQIFGLTGQKPRIAKHDDSGARVCHFSKTPYLRYVEHAYAIFQK
jgi:hypothetical protein